ncbi:YdcF family protein [Paenibacillus filicis]|uniref:YdcF family protein n=1 Tax=Paenibacillus gyeongsangnamensis TaxID=3388067 RepID=A0ABT4QGP9_9BACL|nr:YdcF family protein [Paenibacillus filicis]MCZ8516053.1 YdcF family protein [Paenibacillus filicis]
MLMLLLYMIVSLIIVLLLFFVWLHTAPIQKKGTDALIILGFQCDGDNIHPLLQERLTTAIDLLSSVDYKKVILTGGAVKSTQSEAVIMRDYLIRHAVNEERIVLEQNALDTIQNISNCQTIMKQFNLKTCTVISNSFHIRRVQYIADFLGLSSCYYANRSIRALFGQCYRTLHELKTFYITYKLLKKMSLPGG